MIADRTPHSPHARPPPVSVAGAPTPCPPAARCLPTELMCGFSHGPRCERTGPWRAEAGLGAGRGIAGGDHPVCSRPRRLSRKSRPRPRPRAANFSSTCKGGKPRTITALHLRPPRPPGTPPPRARGTGEGGMDGAAGLARSCGAFSGLCKNRRQTPIFTTPVFHHFLHSPQSVPRGRAEGARVDLGTPGTARAMNGPRTPPLQKPSADPYFYHTSFPPLFAFSAVGTQRAVLRARERLWAARVRQRRAAPPSTCFRGRRPQERQRKYPGGGVGTSKPLLAARGAPAPPSLPMAACP